MRRLLPAVLGIVAIVVSGALVSHAGTSFSGGGVDLSNAGAVTFADGIATAITGPSDQPLVVTAGAGQALTLGAASGQNVNVQGALTITDGQGAIDHIVGPSDVQLTIDGAVGCALYGNNTAAFSCDTAGNGRVHVRLLVDDGDGVGFGSFSSIRPKLESNSSTTLSVRLGDDSAFAPFSTGALTLNGAATVAASLGAIDHLIGPSDQPLVVTAAASRGLTLGAASGQTLSLATGNVSIGDTVTSYGGTATAGRGLAHIVAYGSSTDVDGTTIATYTTGGAAEALEVGGSLICTAISSGSVEIELTYTAGGTVRTHDAFGTAITTAGVGGLNAGSGPGDLKLYTLAIAADAATAVTWRVSRSGTNTATWYGWIKRVN